MKLKVYIKFNVQDDDKLWEVTQARRLDMQRRIE